MPDGDLDRGDEGGGALTAPAARSERPFPGLVPFTEGESGVFFGRDADIERVVGNVLARRVTVLFGPSGVGKSSLVRAGVVPRLRQGYRDEPHEVATCSRWADGAGAGLREGLGEWAGELEPALELAQLLRLAAERTEGHLTIVLDQLEELLGSGPQRELAQSIASAPRAVNFLLVIREDAFGLLEQFAALVPKLFETLIALEPLDRERGRAAIERPIAVWNEGRPQAERVTLDPELVELVLDGVSGAGGARERVDLPYLQLVMATLWERAPRALTAHTLRELGGVRAVVAGHVEVALANLEPSQQRALARMLDALITPSGAKIPQSADDLALHTGLAQEEAREMLERLTSGARLLEPLSDFRYQLSHDAVSGPLREWRTRFLARERSRRERRRLLLTLLFVAVVLWLASLAHAFAPLESLTVNARFAVRGTQAKPRDVVLVATDDASLRRLKTELPVPRHYYGRALDTIIAGHPRAVAYDITFTNRTPDDQRFLESVNGAGGRVVLAAAATDAKGRPDVFGGFSEILPQIGARAGYSGFREDRTGVIRRPLYAGAGLESFALATAKAAHAHIPARSEFSRALLDFQGPAGTVRTVPLWRVASADRSSRVSPELFRNKVVVVGVTSAAETDLHPVWGTRYAEMTGAEIQATAIETILRRLPLRDSAPIVALLATLLLGVATPLALYRFSLPVTLALALLAGAAYLLAAQLLFEAGWVLPLVAPLAALLISTLTATLVRIITAPEGRSG